MYHHLKMKGMTVAFRATVFQFPPAILISQQDDIKQELLRTAESEVRYEERLNRDRIYH